MAISISTLVRSLLPFLWLLNYSNASYICKNLSLENCTVTECTPSTFSLECPKIQSEQWNFLIKVKFKKSTDLILECTSHDVDYEWLKGINVGYVNMVDIRSCPLPNHRFHSLLNILNITSIKKIRIDHGFESSTLHYKYFENFENITHLLLPNNGLKELSAQLFQNMKNLTNLDLHENNLTLTNNELTHLRTLKKLELGANNIHAILPGTFQNLKHLEFLNLWGNFINNLSHEMFQGLENVQSLDISVNLITNISEDAFRSLKNLSTLNLLKNNFASLPKYIFSFTKKLEVIRLQNNERLSQIPSKLFADLPLLQEINLSRCNISSVPQDIFWGSPMLRKIDLSGNQLATLPIQLFRDAIDLKELDISSNKISFLPDSTFSQTTKMEILHIEKNKLTTINDELFQGLNKLQSLFVNNNSISHVHPYAFHSLKDLQKVVMSHNQLTFENFIVFDSSPLSHCTNLEEINLSHNKIHTVFSDWMWILRKLRNLDLSYNNFTSIEAQSMQFFSPQLQVNLQFNKIRTVDLRFLEAMNSENLVVEVSSEATIMNLTGNELDCDCKVYDLLRYKEGKMHPITYKRLKLLVNDLICKSPAQMIGHPITTLSSQTFKCEWPFKNKCPEQCQCFQWLAAKHLIVNCTGAGLTRIPTEVFEPNFSDKLLIDLFMDYNSLQSLSFNESLQQINVTTLSVSHNYISWIENNVFPNSLKILNLDHNNMTRINSSLLEFFTNRTNLTFHNNPWSCNCDSLDFLGFLQGSFKQVENLNNVTCKDGSSLVQLSAEDICPFDKTATIIASSMIAVIGIILGLLAALYFRYQNEVKVWLYAHNLCLWFVTEDELDKDKMYDAFISYSHQDEEFVATKLLPQLENGSPPYKICIHYRDWIVGEFITTQIVKSVDNSKRTIVVLSRNFIKSEWGRLEFRAAHKQALTEKRARVIVVVYGELGTLEDLDSELRSYLSTNTYLKWGDPWFWDKLRYALPHNRRTYQNNKTQADKMELINSSAAIQTSTISTEEEENPMKVVNDFSKNNCNILKDSFANNSFSRRNMETPTMIKC